MLFCKHSEYIKIVDISSRYVPGVMIVEPSGDLSSAQIAPGVLVPDEPTIIGFLDEEKSVPYLEIIYRKTGDVVTVIEVLSPSNKVGAEQERYIEKQTNRLYINFTTHIENVTPMKYSLSVRVAESFHNKRIVDIPLMDLAQMAKAAGFDALCMRASMVGVQHSTEEIALVRQQMDELGLAISMVTGDFAVPENGDAGPGCLRNITPHLDLAEALGADLIRTCIKVEDDLPFAQRAADEAKERKIRLAHQSHLRSLFETVDGSLEVLQKIGRENFGLIYEPANLSHAGQSYGEDTLRRFQPYLFNVYVQNHAVDPNGDLPMETWTNGTVMTTLRPLDEPGGIDFDRVFAGLKAIGYDGYVTSHQALTRDSHPQETVGRYGTFLRSLGE